MVVRSDCYKFQFPISKIDKLYFLSYNLWHKEAILFSNEVKTSYIKDSRPLDDLLFCNKVEYNKAKILLNCFRDTCL